MAYVYKSKLFNSVAAAGWQRVRCSASKIACLGDGECRLIGQPEMLLRYLDQKARYVKSYTNKQSQCLHVIEPVSQKETLNLCETRSTRKSRSSSPSNGQRAQAATGRYYTRLPCFFMSFHVTNYPIKKTSNY